MQLPDFDYESSLIPASSRYLLAIDEVGRGPWAGPVTMAACFYDLCTPSRCRLYDYALRDSKLLSACQRVSLCGALSALPHLILSKDNAFIDTYGLATSLTTLISELVAAFPQADFLLIDGNYRLKIPINYRSIVAGDRKCATIAAASILAKVFRDDFMEKVAKMYPQYGFEKHKGYGTAFHRAALKQYGPCPIHRRSFRPVQDFYISP